MYDSLLYVANFMSKKIPPRPLNSNSTVCHTGVPLKKYIARPVMPMMPSVLIAGCEARNRPMAPSMAIKGRKVGFLSL